MKLFSSKQSLLTTLIVLVVAFSWIIYPFSTIYFLAPTLIKIIFSGLFLVVGFLLFVLKAPQVPKLGTLHYSILIVWAIYLFILFLASVQSHNVSAIGNAFNFFIKVVFLSVLIMYLSQVEIYETFRLYSYLMLICVILALIVVVGVALNKMQPLYTLVTITANEVPRELNYYFGAVYGYSSVPAPFRLYRVQSLIGEPGSFAMVLAPAFYWFLLFEKKRLKTAIIAIGLISTFSLGIVLCFLFIIVLVSFQRHLYLRRLILFLLVLFIVSPILVFGVSNITHNSIWLEYLGSKLIGEGSSLGAKLSDIQITFSYLSSNSIGTGAGVGMSTVKAAISNGYVKALLEAGFLGGIFYFMLFVLIGILAYQMMKLSNQNCSRKRILTKVVGLSVITVLFMGTQREQPDLSFWHMWLYASLFVVSSRKYWRADNAPR